MKTRIYHPRPDDKTVVIVEQDNPAAAWSDDATARIETRYFVPRAGGYVRIYDEKQCYPQVCDGLSDRGATLHCSDSSRLIDVIRREYRRSQRQARRQELPW